LQIKREFFCIARAQVVWGKGDYAKCFVPAARKNSFRKAGGRKGRGLGGSLPAGRQGIFARLLCRAKRGWGWERLRSLAPSREAKQNIFQSHLEENLARASLKEKERNVLLCAAVRRAEPRGGVCARHGADCRSKKVRAFSNKGHINFSLREKFIPNYKLHTQITICKRKFFHTICYGNSEEFLFFVKLTQRA
jgi:hypothetical protein